MSEEIKAPVIEGFEICTFEEYKRIPTKDSASFAFSENKPIYYKRIKPKEKSIEEMTKELTNIYPSGYKFENFTLRLLKYIEENYVKKEG